MNVICEVSHGVFTNRGEKKCKKYCYTYLLLINFLYAIEISKARHQPYSRNFLTKSHSKISRKQKKTNEDRHHNCLQSTSECRGNSSRSKTKHQPIVNHCSYRLVRPFAALSVELSPYASYNVVFV